MTDYKLHKMEPTNSIRFFNGTNTDERNEVLRISRDGVWANPDIPVDDAAKLVLKAIDGYVKTMVGQAVEAEREAAQERIDALYAMYEQACKQRDELMDQQRAQIAAMRGQIQ